MQHRKQYCFYDSKIIGFKKGKCHWDKFITQNAMKFLVLTEYLK